LFLFSLPSFGWLRIIHGIHRGTGDIILLTGDHGTLCPITGITAMYMYTSTEMSHITEPTFESIIITEQEITPILKIIQIKHLTKEIRVLPTEIN